MLLMNKNIIHRLYQKYLAEFTNMNININYWPLTYKALIFLRRNLLGYRWPEEHFREAHLVSKTSLFYINKSTTSYQDESIMKVRVGNAMYSTLIAI